MGSWAKIDGAATKADVALRIRHLDFILLELIVNSEVELASELASALDQRCGPGAQLELEPIVTETDESAGAGISKTSYTFLAASSGACSTLRTSVSYETETGIRKRTLRSL